MSESTRTMMLYHLHEAYRAHRELATASFDRSFAAHKMLASSGMNETCMQAASVWLNFVDEQHEAQVHDELADRLERSRS